jgi:hypothetical protein
MTASYGALRCRKIYYVVYACFMTRQLRALLCRYDAPHLAIHRQPVCLRSSLKMQISCESPSHRHTAVLLRTFIIYSKQGGIADILRMKFIMCSM